MTHQEPIINVGIFEHELSVEGVFNGPFELPDAVHLEGSFRVYNDDGTLVLFDATGREIVRRRELHCRALSNATFTLRQVTIGIQFHWERKEDQTFEGNLRLLAREGGSITAINEIELEHYLKSVIASEMSAEAPAEFLKAHAITSRSWLAAMLKRQKGGRPHGSPAVRSLQTDTELIRWYDREDHTHFDVCADDHCQRYQGITKIISPRAAEAVENTRGLFLVFNDEVCDARFYKACGGLTEDFRNAWEDRHVPYLTTISDSGQPHALITSEDDARQWILSSPDAYCNTTDGRVLRQILPSFDQETTDFFRWSVVYSREELQHLIEAKSGIDFGTLLDLTPVQRGPSGRLVKLRIEGTKRTLVVGKELEIRRWLSTSHLYSSAFVVDVERDERGIPVRFTLHGAGWGHGVGMCQIGAAVMAARGKRAEEILHHYFGGAQLGKLY